MKVNLRDVRVCRMEDVWKVGWKVMWVTIIPCAVFLMIAIILGTRPEIIKMSPVLQVVLRGYP